MNSEIPSYNSEDELKRSLVYDIQGIIKISQLWKKPFKPLLFKISFFSWLLVFLSVIMFKVAIYPLIIEVKNLIIPLLSCILGFTIGGYSILIGFTQPGLVEKISGPRQESIFSLYQLASASFACNILIQGIVLIFAYFIHLVSWIDVNKQVQFQIANWLVETVNMIALAIILLGFILSIFIILQLVNNVFNFSQLYHYNINKIKLDSKKRDDNDKDI